MKPTVGRVVHYVSFGTPGGEYTSECRAAIVTETDTSDTVGLCVLNPTGQFFNRTVCKDDGGDRVAVIGGKGHGRQEFTRKRVGPVLCDGLQYDGGTWHWPAREA